MISTRFFLLICVFPLLCYFARAVALWYLNQGFELAALLDLTKITVMLVITYLIVNKIAFSDLVAQKGVQPLIDKKSKSIRMSILIFSAIAIFLTLFEVKLLGIFFPIQFAIAVSLLTSQLLIAVPLVGIATILGSKGALFFAIVYLWLANGAKLKYWKYYLLALPVLVFLFLFGRVATSVYVIHQSFDIREIIKLFIAVSSDNETFYFLINSITKRLNQYDGVHFILDYGTNGLNSVFDPVFLATRLFEALVPGFSGTQSFGAYIGRLMHPGIEFNLGFAGSLGLMGQLAYINVIEFGVFIGLTAFIMTTGSYVFRRVFGFSGILIFCSLVLVPVVMSGNMDTVLISHVRLIFACFAFFGIHFLVKKTVG